MHAVDDTDDALFIAALLGEDELGVVVRAHIHVEAALLQLLDRMIVHPTPLEKMGLDFAQRVNLAMALGLKAKHGPPLLALGTLRNAFAHRPGTKLTKDRVDNLYKAFASDDRVTVQKCYEVTKATMGASVPAFRSLAPKGQFMIMATSLRAMLIAAERHVVPPGAV